MERVASHDDDPVYPADMYLELALIGKVFIDQSMDGLNDVKPTDFYFGRHGELFSRMRETWEGELPLDPVIVTDRDNELFAIIAEAQGTAEPLTPATVYARQVRDLAEKRHMIPMVQQLAQMTHNGVSTETILNFMEHEVGKRRGRVASINLFDRWMHQGITAADAANLGIVERHYLVEDLIREKSVSIFYGAPGEFKSALCMDLAICVANGIPWLQPLFGDSNTQRAFATKQSRILWLNYDQGHDDVIERLGAMAREYGGGENVTAISHSNPPAVLESESQARALGEYCRSEGYHIVMVDSLLDVKGDNDLQEASMGDVLRMWRMVAETGNVSVVIIAHNTKVSLDLYGSQFIKAKLDHLYFVSRPGGGEVAVIESKKQRSFGEQSKLYARWTYQHYENTRTLRTARFYGGSAGDKPPHKNNTTQAAILNVLMASPGRKFDVPDLTNILNENRNPGEHLSPDAIRKAANRLAENTSNVFKTEAENGGNRYHYGELVNSE